MHIGKRLSQIFLFLNARCIEFPHNLLVGLQGSGRNYYVVVKAFVEAEGMSGEWSVGLITERLHALGLGFNTVSSCCRWCRCMG